MQSRKKLLALLGAATLALTACSGGGGGGGTANQPEQGALVKDGTFTMAISTDPGTLDPTATSLSVARAIDRLIYGRLVAPDEEGTIQPMLAESWTVDSTTEATFVLQEGLTCEDGSPLTATAVADNFNFIGDPANGAPMLGLQVQPGTTATGDDATRTVTITSGQPDAFLLDNLGALSIVCGTVLDDADARAKGQGSTGLFKVDEITPNSQLTLVRRDDFTGGPDNFSATADGVPAKILIKIIPNETTAANMLLSGEVNSATILGPDRERLMDGRFYQSKLLAPIGQMSFKQADGAITQDIEVRRALTQALDFDQLRAVIGQGSAEVPTGLVTVAPNPCAAPTITDQTFPAFDKAAAEKTLDDAGWKLGSDGVREKDGERLSISLLYGTQLGDPVISTAELIQATWSAIGVEVKLKGVDSPGLSEAYFATSDWDASIAPLTVGLPSQLVPFYSGPTPPNGMNFAFLDNQDYVDGVTAGASKAGQAGCDDWAAAEESLFETLSVVPYANVVRGSFAYKATYLEDDGMSPTTIRLYE